MGANSGLNPYDTGENPNVDTGTGAFPGPPIEVTVESPPDHLSGPTGAHPGPPDSVTTYEWPGGAGEVQKVGATVPVTQEMIDDEVANRKAVHRPQVEDKAVRRKKGS